MGYSLLAVSLMLKLRPLLCLLICKQRYNLEAIEKSVHAQQLVSAPTDISFLVAHFKELSEEAQRYLIWASLFGPAYVTTF